jgi:hypothetical protein
MWGFGFMFWLLPLILLSLACRRRRWGAGPRWDRAPDGLRREMEAQRDTIERLESQVLQLEERLDFTERLLSSRGVPAVHGA